MEKINHSRQKSDISRSFPSIHSAEHEIDGYFLAMIPSLVPAPAYRVFAASEDLICILGIHLGPREFTLLRKDDKAKKTLRMMA